MLSDMLDQSRAIGGYVAQKVARLQANLLGKGPGVSSARAALAQLRRLSGSGLSSWVRAGEVLFDGMPDLDLSEKSEERMMGSVKASLCLYAYHQQSKNEHMALVRHAGDGGRSQSFGESCRCLVVRNSKLSAGVSRRLSSAEAATSIAGVEQCLRGIVFLLREEGVPVDYGRLARDLYSLQFEGMHDQIFMRWARDYYRSSRSERAPEGDNPNSEKKEI